jgi:hypothetical protein
VPAAQPNKPIQPTPLAASEIGAILTVRICYNHIAVYWCGAADGQLVGPHGVVSSLAVDLDGNRARGMLSLGGRASAHAYPSRSPARHARITCGS